MEMPGRKYQAASSYRYGFNGKEKTDEVSGRAVSLDFGARIYDTRIGKWLSIDPEFKKYPHFSPFVAFGDNPVYYIDPGGETLRVAFHNEGERKKVETALQKLTNDKVSVLKDGSVTLIKSAQNPGKKLIKGTQLLRDVDGHSKTATITYDSKMIGAGSLANNVKNSQNGTGSDVAITLGGIQTAEQVNVNGKTVDRAKDEGIVLGSELIHGLLAMDGYSEKPAQASNTYKNIYGDERTEYQDLEELEVHGLGGWSPPSNPKRKSYPTETELQGESKRPKRVAYEPSSHYMGNYDFKTPEQVEKDRSKEKK